MGSKRLLQRTSLPEKGGSKGRAKVKGFGMRFCTAHRCPHLLDVCMPRDIILPGEVKDIMNQVLVAQKQAQANVIMRREETASTRSLLNTAQLMESNEMLFKLKEMEYVEKIAGKIGEITVAGNGKVLDQLKSIFTPTK